MFSAELAEILRHEGVEVIGYVIDKSYKTNDCFNNLPVYAFEDVNNLLDVTRVEFVLSLGYSSMNEHRESKYDICKSRGYKVFTFISNRAIVYSNKIGEGSLILPGTYIGPFSEVGICTVIRPGTVLAHHDKIGDFNWIADGCTFGGGVTCGSHCFLGLGTTVRNEISVADYTFTGAKSCVINDTLKDSAYVGVPAKKISKITAREIIAKV